MCVCVCVCVCLVTSGIDLENIVYYKDDTHYFVMTAKKQSLLEKGVIMHVSSYSPTAPHATVTVLKHTLSQSCSPGGLIIAIS